MKKLLIALLLAVGLGIGGVASAAPAAACCTGEFCC